MADGGRWDGRCVCVAFGASHAINHSYGFNLAQRLSALPDTGRGLSANYSPLSGVCVCVFLLCVSL